MEPARPNPLYVEPQRKKKRKQISGGFQVAPSTARKVIRHFKRCSMIE